MITMHGKSCSHYARGYCLIGCRSEGIKPGRSCNHDLYCACHSKGATYALAEMVLEIINKNTKDEKCFKTPLKY